MSTDVITLPAYETLVRPTANLKRSVWSYFGIPANKAGNILTRSCVVCIECQRPFHFKSPHDDHLRDHLQLEHPDQFRELCDEKTSRPNGTPLLKTSRTADSKRKASPARDEEPVVVYEQQLSLDAEYIDEEVEEYVLESEEIETIEFLMHEEAQTVAEETVPEKNAAVPVDKVAQKRRKSGDSECTSSSKRSRADPATATGLPSEVAAAVPAVIRPPTVAPPRLQRLVAEMCADDLMQPHQLAGRGFARLVRELSDGATTQLPDEAAVTDELHSMHSALLELNRVADGEPFALAIERWPNAQGLHHYTLSTLLGPGAHNRRNLCTWSAESGGKHSQQTPVWAAALAILDLAQCQAIVVNFCATDADIAPELPDCLFGSDSTVPVVRCIRAIIEREIRAAIVALPAYAICALAPDCADPMHGMQVLAEWCEQHPDGRQVPETERVLECLQPLKIALDTLRLEDEASASLCRPLAQQLVANHFGEEADEELQVDGTLLTIRGSVRTALTEHILSNQFLATCSYLDPRFHALTDDEALLPGIRDQIRARCPKPLAAASTNRPPTETAVLPPTAASVSATAPTKPAQKAGLSFFFAAAKKPVKPRAPPAPPIDIELQRYATSVEAVPLDQSPRHWWRSATEAAQLPLLAAIAQRCWAVPAMLPPAPDGAAAFAADRRRRLRSDATLSAVLALHDQRLVVGSGERTTHIPSAGIADST